MESNYRFHGGQEQQLMGPPNMANSPYQAYRPVGTPNMASPHQRLSPMTPVTSRLPASPPVQHMRQPNSRSIQSSPNLLHLASPQSALGRSAYSMSPPLSVSDTARTPRSMPTTNTRRMPNARITRDAIENSYVSFILHANPAIPSSTDTSELRKALKLIPKSDGKVFDLFNLWELIRRLDGGELKTWIQLAVELGVEPPMAGQSAQKVQQYVVRLKRWMHAMHIDAFFDYCLGKRHIYFTQIPTTTPAETPDPRDGVPPEEDLAIRALIPGWKPKRGRKKASERDDSEADERPHKRPQIEISPAMLEYQGLEGPSMFPQGAMTWSAFPDDPEAQDPWGNAGLAITHAAVPQNETAISTSLADQRWHRALSPSAYPQSAIEPSYSIDDAFDIPEPRSAIAPNTSAKTAKTRRRNGAALSSAWNPSGPTSTGKARGRPAASRPSQEPSFPSQRIQASRPPSRPSSVTTATSARSFQIHAPMPQPGRPAKLSLQVPQHTGGPIRLATPPTVMLNVPATVVTNNQDGRSSADFYRVSEGVATFLDHESIRQEQVADAFDISIDDVAHAFAARILHGKLIGRQGSLSLEEATLISNKAIEQLRHDWPDELSEEAFAVRCATALGVSSDLGTGSGAASIINVKSMPQPLHLFSRNRGRNTAASGSTTAPGRDGTVEYVLSFDIVYGSGISSNVQIHNIFIPLHVNDESFEREINVLRAAISSGKSRDSGFGVGEAGMSSTDVDEEEKSWKEKYLDLQKQMKRKDELLKKMRRRVFEVVMAGDP